MQGRAACTVRGTPDLVPNLQAFLDAAFEFYTRLQSGSRDTARYLLMPVKAAAGGRGKAEEAVVYKRYRLSDEKTFDSFFHDDKAALLRLVDQFMEKSGRFCVAGYPQKLGLLLHGPPGTGKTSLIKALAHYTKRSIVAVPLQKIKTNGELMDVLCDQSFLVKGEGGAG